MLEHLENLPLAAKLAVSLGTVAATLVADLATDAKGLEDLGLKALLLGALVFTVRLLLKQQDCHKSENDKRWEIHSQDMKRNLDETRAREARTLEALDRNSDAIVEIGQKLDAQNNYFRTLAQRALDEKFPPLPGE